VRQRKRTTRLASGLLLTAVAALSAQACTSAAGGTATAAGAAGSSSSVSSDAVWPQLTLSSAQAAFRSYATTSDQAAQTGNRTLALSVLTGMASDAMSIQYLLTKQSGTLPPYTRYTYGTPAFYLPKPPGAGQPQYFVANVARTLVPGTTAMTSSGQDKAAGVQLPSSGRVLMLFEKSASSGHWRLASLSQLAPGQAVPALATDSHGYAIVESLGAPSSTALVRPALAPALQATVVDDGPSSAASQVVASGPLTTGMYDQAASAARGITAPPGDVHQWLLEGSSYARLALATADGGVLVLYSMYLNNIVETKSALDQDISVTSGPAIAVPDFVKPLLPASRWTPHTRLQVQDILSFAAIDPPAAQSGQKIQVIAIGGGLRYAYSN
jgi:hypothetical protein